MRNFPGRNDSKQKKSGRAFASVLVLAVLAIAALYYNTGGKEALSATGGLFGSKPSAITGKSVFDPPKASFGWPGSKKSALAARYAETTPEGYYSDLNNKELSSFISTAEKGATP